VFRLSNFGQTSFIDAQSKSQKMYGMTKNGMHQDKVVNLLRDGVVSLSGVR